MATPAAHAGPAGRGSRRRVEHDGEEQRRPPSRRGSGPAPGAAAVPARASDDRRDRRPDRAPRDGRARRGHRPDGRHRRSVGPDGDGYRRRPPWARSSNVVERPSSPPGHRALRDQPGAVRHGSRPLRRRPGDRGRPPRRRARPPPVRPGRHRRRAHQRRRRHRRPRRRASDPTGLADLIRGLYTFYEAPEARPDAIAAEAAVAAAPDPERAADAPVLQEVSAAVAADVPPLPTPGDAAAERNEELAASAPEPTEQAPEAPADS